MRSPSLSILALVVTATTAPAQMVGEPAAGRRIAERVCSECHTVGEEGVMKDYPPSFWAIARYRDDFQIRARIWSPPAHANMPFFAEIMRPDQVGDLVAYIRSLEE